MKYPSHRRCAVSAAASFDGRQLHFFFAGAFFFAMTLAFSRSMFMASLTSARMVSELFSFVLSHCTCSGVSQTLTRSVFLVAIEILREHSQHFGDAPCLRDTAARHVRRIAVETF